MVCQLGKEIAKARIDRDLTQEQLAHALGRRQAYVSLLEHGKAKPSWDVVLQVARLLDLDLNQLKACAESPPRRARGRSALPTSP